MDESYRPFLLEIRGVLSIGEFHVGSGARLSISTDGPVLRDAQDRPYLPASSLRGVLRAHLESEAALLDTRAERLLASLFGQAPKANETLRSRSGRLRIFDATVLNDGLPFTEIRDHVKIDSKSGAAKSGAKFDQEVATATRLGFRLVYEGDTADDGELVLLKEAIRALEWGDLSCGAKGGLGYGRLHLEQTKYASFDRRAPDQLAKWLDSRLTGSFDWSGPNWPGADCPAEAPATAKVAPYSLLHLTLTLQFDGPVLVRSPIPPPAGEVVFDARNREHDVAKGLSTADRTFVQTGPGNAYYLPAASLRGVLRHQAERIARTLLGSTSAVDELFGDVGESARKGLIQVSSGELKTPETPAKPVYLDHVAIDRITGFAADSRKFATCGLQSPRFETTVRLRFRKKDLHLVALAGFVLRDLLDGMLWCGGGTSRGYGYIKSASVTSAMLDWTPGTDVPADFLPAIPRSASGWRTRIAVKGPIPFNSWFWREAETAWTKALEAVPPKGQSK